MSASADNYAKNKNAEIEGTRVNEGDFKKCCKIKLHL